MIKPPVQRGPGRPEGSAGEEWVIEIATLRALHDARALLEGELADLLPEDAVSATGLLADELTARIAQSGLLPVRLSVRRDDAGVEVGVGWRSGPGHPSAMVDQWCADAGTDWGLMVTKHLADACGVSHEPEGGGRLWARLSTL